MHSFFVLSFPTTWLMSSGVQGHRWESNSSGDQNSLHSKSGQESYLVSSCDHQYHRFSLEHSWQPTTLVNVSSPLIPSHPPTPPHPSLPLTSESPMLLSPLTPGHHGADLLAVIGQRFMVKNSPFSFNSRLI
ncbi:hypothetical protein RRG08_015427 [Elysia crispata]|uniref:Uncharacterized protein n=1 Tax=Elysia crispata TaxID=231223 RepID=A0AAE1CYK6_9GAST|nr:hypothetical protein RRG08_015427 [Elysia crispata]